MMSITREMLSLLLHQESHRFDVLCSKLEKVLANQEKLMSTQADIVAKLNDTNAKLVKIAQETTTLLAKIDELKQAIASGPVTPELQAAVDALAAQANVVDDLVPDAPPVSPPAS